LPLLFFMAEEKKNKKVGGQPGGAGLITNGS
jgi:hypothetical protein